MERNRAVAYIRVSKDVEEQKTSLENQRSQFIQYLKENNMSYAGIYVDVETGVNEGREQLKQMLEDGKEKKYDIIIAKEISRICRNAKLGYEIKNLTDTKNIRLLTMDGKIDTHDAEKNALFGLHLWIAESEAETVSRRIKASIKTRMKKGNFIGSFAPYGYIKKNHQLHIRKDNTPDVVKEIFDLFLQGWGQDKIANHLTRQGIPTPAEVAGKKNAGKYWQGSTIYLILKNQAYIGNLIQGKEATINAVNHDRRKIPQSEQIVIEKKHEPIVDIATFNQVQEMIKRKNRKGKGKIKQQKHLFTNHLFCEDCGKSLWYRKNQKVMYVVHIQNTEKLLVLAI